MPESDKLNVAFPDTWDALGVNPDPKASLEVSRTAGFPLPNMEERQPAVGVGRRFGACATYFSLVAQARMVVELHSLAPGGTLLRRWYHSGTEGNSFALTNNQNAWDGLYATGPFVPAVKSWGDRGLGGARNIFRHGTLAAAMTYTSMRLPMDTRDDLDLEWIYVPAGFYFIGEQIAAALATDVTLVWVELEK